MRNAIPKFIPVLTLLILAGCQTELFTDIAESDANEMVAVLQQHGISASKTRQKDGRDTLAVEKSQFAQAVRLLRDAGLPRKTFENMGEVFQPSGLVASPVQERARYVWALGQELSRTISDIDGVVTARVQVVLPNNDLLNRDPTPSSASVFVRYDQNSSVATLTPQIKQLVANSVEGLSYDKVSVVLVPAVTPSLANGPANNGSVLGTVGTRLAVFAVLIALAAGAWAAATRFPAAFGWQTLVQRVTERGRRSFRGGAE